MSKMGGESKWSQMPVRAWALAVPNLHDDLCLKRDAVTVAWPCWYVWGQKGIILPAVLTKYAKWGSNGTTVCHTQ